MAALSVSRAWEETKAVLRRDGRLFTTVALAFFVLPGVLSDLVAPPSKGEQLPGLGVLLLIVAVALLLLVGALAITCLALKGQVTVREAIGQGFRRVPVLVAASLLWAIPFLVLFVILLGPYIDQPESIPPSASLFTLLLMIAYAVIGIRMMLLTPLSVAESAAPVGMIRRSWELTRGHWWKLFGFFILSFLSLGIALLAVRSVFGTIAAAIGDQLEPLSVPLLIVSLATQIVTAAALTIISVMIARIYMQLSGAHEAATVPHAP